MINQDIIKDAVDAGLPAIKNLFENLPKDDAVKGLGLLVIMGISLKVLEIIKEIVIHK